MRREGHSSREPCTKTLEITSNRDDNLNHIIYILSTSTAFGTSMEGVEAFGLF